MTPALYERLARNGHSGYRALPTMTVTCCGPVDFAAAKRLAHHLHLARSSRFVVFLLKGSARAVGKGAHRHSSNFRAVLGFAFVDNKASGLLEGYGSIGHVPEPSRSGDTY